MLARGKTNTGSLTFLFFFLGFGERHCGEGQGVGEELEAALLDADREGELEGLVSHEQVLADRRQDRVIQGFTFDQVIDGALV